MKDKKIFNQPAMWWVRAAIMAVLPLLCCVAYCALQGKTLLEVYLPASEWNDELFYYKQVEAILENGYPYGYFGFNESHADWLSFAAWSPVLVIPWVIWGAIFGWNLMSPIWCNLFLMGAAIAAFVLLTRPNKKQMGMLAVLYCVFPMFTRYILSGMPEIICFFTVILFFGVAVNYLRFGSSNAKLVWMFLFSMGMTLMRPYMLLLMLLPGILWIKKSGKWWSVAGTLGLMAVTFGGYAIINGKLGAEYLEPLFSLEWLTVMLEEGFFEGIKFVVYMIADKGIQFLRMSVEALRSGYADGIYFLVFLVAYILLIVHFIQSLKGKKKTEALLFGHVVFCFTGMLGAMLLMYLLHDGKRHLMTFVVIAIFLLSIAEWKQYVKVAILGVLCIYLYGIKADSPMDYKVPFASEEKIEWMQYWTDAFGTEMEICYENVPNYESAVIWVLADNKPGEQVVLTDWQALYAIPKGMGINCCQSQYVKDNIDALKCRYLTTLSGGTVDIMCQGRGFEEIGRKDTVVAYRVH